jgi:hypothetical protein
MRDKDDIKAYFFFGTMVAIFCSGAALTCEASILKAIGTGMVMWVVGFYLAAIGFPYAMLVSDDEAETK